MYLNITFCITVFLFFIIFIHSFFNLQQEVLTPISEASPHTHTSQLSGVLANVDSLYPEWSLENHNFQGIVGVCVCVVVFVCVLLCECVRMCCGV